MAFHLHYRPQTFKEVIGNEATVKALSSIIKREDCPHTFLLSGPAGCGKTTLARILAKELGCNEMDFKELNSADFRGIDTVREMISQMSLRPLGGKARVWLLDECHQLSKDAQNALLKALEDTPPHVYFMLATTEPKKLLDTIRSRCSTYAVAPLTKEQMEQLIDGVVLEDLKERLDDEVLDAIIEAAQGSPRVALVLLEQVIDFGNQPKEQLKIIEAYKPPEEVVIDLCRALVGKKPWKTITPIIKGLQKDNQDAEGVRRAILGYCQSILLKDDNAFAFIVIDVFRQTTYDIGWPGITACCYEALDVIKERR